MKCIDCEHLKIERPDAMNEGQAMCDKYDVSTILIGRDYMRKVNRLECYGKDKQNGKQAKAELTSKLNKAFREELKLNVSHKLDEINHYIAGCNSPFGYLQIADVQEKLCEIADILGIKGETE